MKYQYFFSVQNAPHAVNVLFISSYKGIKVVIRTEFINMTVMKLNSILFLREIVLVMRNCCIIMSEIELVFRRAEFRCSGSIYLMLLFKKLYLIQIFNQYFLNKKGDTLRPMDTNLSTWIELSLWRSKRCHEHSMVKFVSMRGYPIPHICVCITEQLWA